MNRVTLEQVTNALGAKREGDSWIAACPFPENHKNADKNPSLAISEVDGKVLVRCRANCDQSSVWKAVLEKVQTGSVSVAPAKEFTGTQAHVNKTVAALPKSAGQTYLESRGISMEVAEVLRLGFAPDYKFVKQDVQQDGIVTPHYIQGELVAFKVRGIREKMFDQIKGSTIQGLYAADSLEDPILEPSVLIFEGDLDVALARSFGFNATGILSAQSRVSDADLNTLKHYKRIFLIGDQDIAGKKAMDELEKRLPAEKVIRVRLPGLIDIGDLYKKDAANFEKNLRKFLRFAQGSREYFELDDLLTEFEMQDSLDDVTPYIVEKLIPANSITMFFGEEKSGKSLLMVYLLKCIANGIKVFGSLAVTQRPVLYLDMENSNNDISGMIEHFTNLGTEPVRYKHRATGCPALDSPGLIQFCEKYKPVIVVDSLTKFSKGQDMFNPGEMSDVFDKMLNLCAAGATILLVHHATRADGEKYASSHQIGANVSRGFAVLSLDRPALNRVRLEAKLFRGAEPTSFNLIGFPVIKERGQFGLADVTEILTDVDMVVDWVRKQEKYPNGPTREDFKQDMKGMSATRKSAALTAALADNRIIKNAKGGLLVPKSTWQEPTTSNTPQRKLGFTGKNEDQKSGSQSPEPRGGPEPSREPIPIARTVSGTVL
jgi:hypothetical protein